MKTNIRLFSLLVISIVLFCCENEQQNRSPSYTLEISINGANYTFRDVRVELHDFYGEYENLSINSDYLSGNPVNDFSLNILDTTIFPKSYSFYNWDEFNPDLLGFSEFFINISEGLSIYEGITIGEDESGKYKGNVIITKVDRTNKTISGSISGQALLHSIFTLDSDSVVTINGEFEDLMYQVNRIDY